MAPKKSVKTSQGLAQPTISFQHRKPGPRSKKSQSTQSVKQSSLSSIDISSSDPPQTEQHVRSLTLETSPEGGKRKKLDVRDKRWKGVKEAAEVEMGYMTPIHAGPETHNDIHHVLRVFDLTSKYGPCVGLTRLQRWERAKKWGLNPPEEIKEILTTAEGQDDVAYRENVLHTWLG